MTRRSESGASPDEGRLRPPDRSDGDRDDRIVGSHSSEVPEILRRRSPREILAALVDGDPLEIAPRVRQQIEDSALLVDPRRLLLRSLARIAHAAPRYSGTPPLTAWIEQRIVQSIDELLAEDRELVRDGTPVPSTSDTRYAYVSEILGLEPDQALRPCVAFNALPREVRSAWFAVAVAGKTVNRYVAEGHGPPENVRAHLKQALRTIARATTRRPRPQEEEDHGEL